MQNKNACDSGYSVYIHIFPNGKRYVGCTRQKPQARWKYGRGYRNQKRLYEAIEEFGWDNIEHIIICENMPESDARQLEIELIKKYDTQNTEHGYNTKNGGQVFHLHSQEFLDDLQERMRGNKYCVGRKLRPSHIEALRKSRIGVSNPSPNKGKHIHTEEQKKIWSLKQKERWKDPEYRKIQSEHHHDVSGSNNPMFGKKHSEETKRKISAKHIGRKMPKECVEKMSLKRMKAVYKCDLDGRIIEKYQSMLSAAESVNGNNTNISFACKHKNRTYKGFKWRYVDDNH